MIIFPNSHKKSFPFEKENMYLARGVRTPAPRSLAMQDGELALFDAELLHGTRLNTSIETRFVITLRVNENLPTFSEDTTHAIYDLWRSSEDVDRGELSAESREKLILGRHALHSHRLRYHHPFRDQPVELVAELPRDMASLLESP